MEKRRSNPQPARKAAPEGPSGENGALGFISIVLLLLSYKEGLPAVYAPFSECNCFMDACKVVRDMDSIAFIGRVGWIAIILTSTITFLYSLTSLLPRK